MGKKSYIKQVDNDVDQGWFRGIMHALLHKNKHVKGIVNPQSSYIKLHDIDEYQLSPESESYMPVNKRSKAHKKSLKSRIKSLLVNKVLKQQNDTKKQESTSSKSQVKTNSIHHIEPSHDGLKKPAIVYLSRNLDNAYKSSDQSKLNKDLFIQLVGNEGRPCHSLTRSGSYPSANLSRQKNFKLSTLEHKKNEIWYQVPDLTLIKCKKENIEIVNPLEQSKPKIDPENNHEIDGNYVSEVKVTHGRSFSGTESLERYNKLYENSSRQEIKLMASKSLKLRNEYNLPSGAQISSLRRIHSLAHFDFWYPIENEKSLETVTENSSVMEEIIQDEETQTNPSVISDQISDTIEDFSEFDDQEEDINYSEMGSERLSITFLGTNSGASTPLKSFQGDNADLCYVKEILERSDISSKEVDVMVFDEMEAYWHKKFESREEDMYGCSHHQLLFDLINEELARIYDRLLISYPKALSCSCNVLPILEGQQIIDEVICRISRLLERKAGKYQTLDNIVSHDLLKEDDWMNLQMESECEALVLEDLIFSELLEEILSF